MFFWFLFQFPNFDLYVFIVSHLHIFRLQAQHFFTRSGVVVDCPPLFS
jgi:hypothetical protein